MELRLRKIRLELKVNWKISRNESQFKENFIVEIRDKELLGLGEVAPNIRYGESAEKIEKQFAALARFDSPDQILQFLTNSSLCHSLSCGLECAALDLKARQLGGDVSRLLNLSDVAGLSTSMSVPIMDEKDLEDYLKPLTRFETIKVKIDQRNALSFVKRVAQITSVPLRIDANEAFQNLDEYLAFEKGLSELNIEFIEQPFPAADWKLYRQLKKRSRYMIMADESIEDTADFSILSQSFHAINLKIMKTGGLRKAIELAQKAREHGLKVMMGCMVETSLGISYAMRPAQFCDYFDLDGSLLVKNDPFHLINESEGKLTLV